MRGPPHILLHILSNGSELWCNSVNGQISSKGHPSVSLLDLLEERVRFQIHSAGIPVLSKKKKKVISVNLAKSLFRLIGTPWLQAPWTSRNIFFWHDPVNETVDLRMAYISCSLLLDNIDPEGPVNDFHYIYAFGVLLLELELDQSISISEEDVQEADDDYPAIYMTLLRIFLHRKEDLDDVYLLDVISSCLELNSKAESISHPSFNDNLKLKAAVLRYILQPLTKRLNAAYPEELHDGSDQSNNQLKMMKYSKSSTRNTGNPFRHISDQDISSPNYRQRLLPTGNPFRRLSGQNISSLNYHQRFLQSRTTSDHLEEKPYSTRLGSFPSYSSTLSLAAPRDRQDFEIAILCALPLESDAIQALFDQHWDTEGYTFGQASGDNNVYSFGLIGRHNVVLVHMPGMGKENAASTAVGCRSSFESIKLALVVGICGGVPICKNGEDIILGDVVISEGLVQYDFGSQLPDQFMRKDTLLDTFGRPNPKIRSLLAKLRGRNRKNLQEKMTKYLSELQRVFGDEVTYPGAKEDKLFHSWYRHKHQISSSCTTCAQCSQPNDRICEESIRLTCDELQCEDQYLASRNRIKSPESDSSTTEDYNFHQPAIHFGLVGSGSTVMKSGLDRDRIATKDNVIAFEMEGAGVWDNLPCIIIKGVCDYADSHKNKRWQNYSAATAAACTKALLENWSSSSF
jgi:nucleoside phosphorylase